MKNNRIAILYDRTRVRKEVDRESTNRNRGSGVGEPGKPSIVIPIGSGHRKIVIYDD